MKVLMTILTAGLVLASVPAFADNRCIDVRNIVSSKPSNDGRVITFKMKDGMTWVNHLQGRCTDLKYYGFAWQLRTGSTQACEREQSFQVLQSMQTCTLGAFDAPTMEKHAANPVVWDPNKVQAPR